MPNELIHPNWHVVLVHYLIALLTLGLAIELLSFLYRRSTLRTAGRWMLLIGARHARCRVLGFAGAAGEVDRGA